MTSNKSDTFGRDELAALVGGNELAFTSTSKHKTHLEFSSKAKLRGTTDATAAAAIDVSNLTTAETAEWLKQNDLAKKEKLLSSQQRGTILRAQKQHHPLPNRLVLLQEEMQNQQHQSLSLSQAKSSQNLVHDKYSEKDNHDGMSIVPGNERSSSCGTNGILSDEEEEKPFRFASSREPQERHKGEPQIVVQRDKTQPQVIRQHQRHHHHHHPSDSSYSSSSSAASSRNNRNRARHSNHDSSEDDDDDEEDARRQRLLSQRRRKQAQQAKQLSLDPIHHDTNVNDTVEETSSKQSNSDSLPQNVTKSTELKQDNDPTHSSCNSSSETSNTGSSDGDSSSSDEEDSSDQELVVMAKPLFVPRHLRNTIITTEQKEEQEEQRAAKKVQDEAKRKMASRMLVAEVVAAAAVSTAQDQMDDDEGGGATNAMPDDNDPTDPVEMEKERDAWEVRELERLLMAQDKINLQLEEKAEYDRRRAMTDEERLLEDRALGLYQRPGEQRRKKGEMSEQGKFLQRYYHRGAFYMDDSEWSNDDVRHKAKDYEGAVTGNDKIDKRALPKIMQVKKFGFARQNTKYKGLAQEDTTDRTAQFVPLANTRRHKKHERS